MTVHSYPSIYSLGHAAIADLLLDPVVVEEKVDGSQFSFQQYSTEDSDRHLTVKSKGAEINPQEPPKMFARAVATVVSLFDRGLLENGWTYRGEVLDTPRHNVLMYNRVPAGHVVLFDVDRGDQDYLPPIGKKSEAAALGLEVVPMLYDGVLSSFEQLKELLERESFLGGPKVEGIVIKNYSRFGKDKKALMGKWVREEFKEAHSKVWAPGPSTIEQIVTRLKTEARWRKAVQHLREAGTLLNAPQDIGPLLKEISLDVLKEHKEEMANALFDAAWKQIARGINAGFPEWYKEQLAKSAFPEAV